MNKFLSKILMGYLFIGVALAEENVESVQIKPGEYTFSHLQNVEIMNEKGSLILKQEQLKYGLVERPDKEGNRYTVSFILDKNGIERKDSWSNFNVVDHLTYKSLLKKLSKVDTVQDLSKLLKCEGIFLGNNFNVIIKIDGVYIPVRIHCGGSIFDIKSEQIIFFQVYTGYQDGKQVKRKPISVGDK